MFGVQEWEHDLGVCAWLVGLSTAGVENVGDLTQSKGRNRIEFQLPPHHRTVVIYSIRRGFPLILSGQT